MINNTTVDQGLIISTVAEELRGGSTVSFQTNPGDSSGPSPLVMHTNAWLVVNVVPFEDVMECQELWARYAVVVDDDDVQNQINQFKILMISLKCDQIH